MSIKPATEKYLENAEEKFQVQVRRIMDKVKGPDGWAIAQLEFTKLMDDYVETELAKPPDHDIDNHEAGGHLRIVFPHQAVRGDSRVSAYMKKIIEARIDYYKADLFHGFSDCAEVHHEIETYIYFQIPLFYWGFAGCELALESIEDFSHHMGNWEKGVPDWYDWENHLFVSAWLGTRVVRDYPPYDYQEANHFRWIDAVTAAYIGTGKERYLNLIIDYTDRWCDHIEALSNEKKPILCSILPEGVKSAEMGSVRPVAKREGAEEPVYRTFYSGVGSNTSFDIASAILDLYRVTGNERYIEAARMMIDQFFDNGKDGLPAGGYNVRLGQWSIGGSDFLVRLALKHDLITGQNRYGEKILEWASLTDEEVNDHDQMRSGLMIAAHYYDHNPDWLVRAYETGFRTYAVHEHDDLFSQCGGGRQGSKFSMELLYHPLLGGADWGTRGNIPVLKIEHRTSQDLGLPKDVAFRTWRIDDTTDGFEAVNMSERPVSWHVKGASTEQKLRQVLCSNDNVEDGLLEIAADGKISGSMIWSSPFAGVSPRVNR